MNTFILYLGLKLCFFGILNLFSAWMLFLSLDTKISCFVVSKTCALLGFWCVWTHICLSEMFGCLIIYDCLRFISVSLVIYECLWLVKTETGLIRKCNWTSPDFDCFTRTDPKPVDSEPIPYRNFGKTEWYLYI